MSEPTFPKEGTQEHKVLRELMDADAPLYSDYFIRTLYLTQFHRAIYNLEHKHGWKIERMPANEFGFYGYVLVRETKQLTLQV